MRISDWSSDVCSSDLGGFRGNASSGQGGAFAAGREQGETGDDRQDASHGGAHRGTAWVIRRRAGACRDATAGRPVERRVGEACVSTWGSGWSPLHDKKRRNASIEKRENNRKI